MFALQQDCTQKERRVGMAATETSRLRIVSQGKGNTTWRGLSSRAPYGLQIIENCLTCPHREDQIFCNLAPAALDRLAKITSASSYPKKATLFVEGQSPRGVFIICEGRVKLSTCSTDGKALIVRIADAGEVLGIPSTVTGKPYELTADVLERTQANFISRSDFLEFTRDYSEVALRVTQQLAESYHGAVAELRSIGLSHSAEEKLARFLLDWCAHQGKPGEHSRATLTLTHEEIAQLVGSSRETVTRLLSNFKRKKMLQLHGSMLILADVEGLRALAGA
jgi:CRP/FNR family transcriptional regulator, cyclic AMP receptor protein